MSRLRRMSKARANWSASVQRRLRAPTLPRAKLQKSQAALQALVTATLQSAGPPRRMRRKMSQALEAKVVMVCKPGFCGCVPFWGTAKVRLAEVGKGRRDEFTGQGSRVKSLGRKRRALRG